MALIQCPECRKEISNKAEQCPYCGCPSTDFINNDSSIDDVNNKTNDIYIENNIKYKRRHIFIIIMIIIVIIFFLFIISNIQKNKKETNKNEFDSSLITNDFLLKYNKNFSTEKESCKALLDATYECCEERLDIIVDVNSELYSDYIYILNNIIEKTNFSIDCSNKDIEDTIILYYNIIHVILSDLKENNNLSAIENMLEYTINNSPGDKNQNKIISHLIVEGYYDQMIDGIELYFNNIKQQKTKLNITCMYNDILYFLEICDLDSKFSSEINEIKTIIDNTKNDSVTEKEDERREPQIGDSKTDIELFSWGRPDHINKTTTKYGIKEQWVYDDGRYLYFEDNVVTAIQE